MKQSAVVLVVCLIITCFTSQIFSFAIRDKETQKIRVELSAFCKKEGKAKQAACLAIRQKFFLAVKAKEFIKDPCGPKKEGEALKRLFPGNAKADQFAKKMAVAKGNIIIRKGDKEPGGLKPIKGTTDKLGKGQANKCKSKA